MNKTGMAIAVAAIASIVGMMQFDNALATSPDLTLVTKGASGGSGFATVAGTAGGTTPTDGTDIYAYVFVTNRGIYAVASHPGFSDSNEGNGASDWHAHKVTLNGNCIATINDDGAASLSGNTVTVTPESGRITTVNNVLAVNLSTEAQGGICVTHVFSAL